MKKRLAWILALLSAVTLCIPAAAYSDEYWEGYYDAYGEAYSIGYTDFENGKPSAYADEDTYEGGYNDGYRESYLEGYEAAKWEAEIHDEDYDLGFADGYEAGFADGQNDTYHYPMDYDYEDHYAIGYADGYSTGYYDALYGTDWDEPSGLDWEEEVIASFGGTVGQVNVMLNGQCIDFDGVCPVNQGGRVMVPVRAILEALGAEVDYDHNSGTVTASLDGKLLVHVIGTASVEVYADGDMAREPETVVMDCKSYRDGGRTMVPIRFLSEALGYYVEWDMEFQTVVLLDLDAIYESYDAQLTVANLVLSDLQKHREPGKTYRRDTDMALDLTMFDTLNGDKRLGASAKATNLFNETGANATLKMDLTQVVDLVMKQYEAYTDEETKQMAELFKQLQIDAIYNAETEQVYVKSPLIDAMLGQEYWVESSLLEAVGGLSSASLLMNLAEINGRETRTMTDMAVVSVLTEGYSWPVFYYDDIISAMDEMVELCGDQNFKKSGSTYTWNALNLSEFLGESAGSVLEWYTAYDGYSNPKTELSFQVTDTGNGTCNYAGRFYFRSDEIELELKLDKRGAGEELTGKLHIKNVFSATLTSESDTRLSSEIVETMPPAAEVSMNLYELYF